VLAHSSIDTFPLRGDPFILQSDNRQSVSSTVSSLIYFWPEIKKFCTENSATIKGRGETKERIKVLQGGRDKYAGLEKQILD
jgi:hypothetical protein